MPVILQVNFIPGDAFLAQPAEQRADYARSLAKEPGLQWKIWLNNDEPRAKGGLYLFDDQASAQAFAEKLRPRLESLGGTDILIRIFGVDERLSALTRAPVALQPA